MSLDGILEHALLSIETKDDALDMSLNSELGRILDEIIYDDSMPSCPNGNSPELVYSTNIKTAKYIIYLTSRYSLIGFLIISIIPIPPGRPECTWLILHIHP